MADEKKFDEGLKVEELGFIAHEYVTADKLEGIELPAADGITFEVETGVNEKGEPVHEAIGKDGLSLKKGDCAKVFAVIAPFISKGVNLIWESSDEEVATVDDNIYDITDEARIELVRAIKAGSAVIKVTTAEAVSEEAGRISAQFSVTVASEEAAVTNNSEMPKEEGQE